jgi:hypothetical protein
MVVGGVSWVNRGHPSREVSNINMAVILRLTCVSSGLNLETCGMHHAAEQRDLEGIMTLEAKEGNCPFCLNVFTGPLKSYSRKSSLR